MKEDVKEQNKLNEFRLKEVHDLLHEDIHQQFIEINAFVRDCAAKEKRASENVRNYSARKILRRYSKWPSLSDRRGAEETGRAEQEHSNARGRSEEINRVQGHNRSRGE